MKRKQTLSFIVVITLLIAIPVITTMLVRSNFEIRIAALEDDTPQNVVISDVKDTSFKVSWLTERRVIGGIELSGGTLFSEDESRSYHLVDVTGLVPGSKYSFKVMSGTKGFGDDPDSSSGKEGAVDFSLNTASTSISDETFLIYGQVFSPDGYSFQQGGIITLKLSTGALSSQVLSTVINETGGYQFNLAGLSTEDLNRAFSYKSEVDATFTIYISHDQSGFEKKFPVNFSTSRQVANIYLGEVNIDVIPGIEGT